jgi:hypothetical protein
LLCPSSPSSLGELSVIALVTLAIIALAFFVALVVVVFIALAIAIHRSLLFAMIAYPPAARLLSADAGVAAASHPPAELLLPSVALYFITADFYVVAFVGRASSVALFPMIFFTTPS